MKRGLTGITIFMFIIAIIGMYLGYGIMTMGEDVSDIGGAFGNELAALGGLWTALGAVLLLLGVLALPIAVGFLGMKEWGRKNGVYVTFFIGAICVVAGFIVAYFDFKGSIIYFVVTVLAIICGQLLREKRQLFELGTGTRKREHIPTYRETRNVEKKVVMRHSKDSVPIRHNPMIKCGRCGTLNDSDKAHCKMCANKLTGN